MFKNNLIYETFSNVYNMAPPYYYPIIGEGKGLYISADITDYSAAGGLCSNISKFYRELQGAGRFESTVDGTVSIVGYILWNQVKELRLG